MRSDDAGAKDAPPGTFFPPPPGNPPRNVADAPAPPPESWPAEGQWALVWREFRKRKLALLATAVIVLLVTASVFAPLLANDRPIAYRGANRFAYADAYRTVRVLLPRIAAADEKARAELVLLAAARIEEMAGQVVPDTAAGLEEFRTQFVNSAVDGLSQDETANLRRSLGVFSPDGVGFVGRWRFPVVATIHGLAAAFLVANTALLVVLALTLALRGPWRKRGRRAAVFALIVLPVAVGLLWWRLVPSENDRTPYKRGISAAEADERADAPVLYETVIWPPVRFGLDEVDQDRKFAPPELFGAATDERQSRWDGRHWFGTDAIGRDVLCRMLWGGRISLSVGLVSVGIYVAIGVVVGALAGYFRGWADMLISRLIEIVIVFPTFFLIVTVVAFIGPGLFKIMLVIGVTGWTGVARLVRGEFLRLADQEFILAGRTLGYSAPRLIFRHVLPNAMAPVLVAATFGIAGAILTESGLSFLGFGVQIPTPSWGGILAQGRATTAAPWLIYIPGFAIFLTILCYNLAGEALRDASDPRLRGSR